MWLIGWLKSLRRNLKKVSTLIPFWHWKQPLKMVSKSSVVRFVWFWTCVMKLRKWSGVIMSFCECFLNSCLISSGGLQEAIDDDECVEKRCNSCRYGGFWKSAGLLLTFFTSLFIVFKVDEVNNNNINCRNNNNNVICWWVQWSGFFGVLSDSLSNLSELNYYFTLILKLNIFQQFKIGSSINPLKPTTIMNESKCYNRHYTCRPMGPWAQGPAVDV